MWSLLGKLLQVRVHALGAAFVNHAEDVHHGDVLALHAQANVVGGTGQAGRSRPAENYLDLGDVLAHKFQRIEQRCAVDDGGAVLVVVEGGNFHGAAQLFLDLEAFGRLDVFQIDGAEGGLQQLADANHVFRLGGVHFQVENINIGEALEEDSFAFHDGLAGKSADVAQAEHGGAVA